METKQQLMDEKARYIEHYCRVEEKITRFLLTEDEEFHIVCTSCGSYRTTLKELPQEKDIKTISMKDFYEKLKKTQIENG